VQVQARLWNNSGRSTHYGQRLNADSVKSGKWDGSHGMLRLKAWGWRSHRLSYTSSLLHPSDMRPMLLCRNRNFTIGSGRRCMASVDSCISMLLASNPYPATAGIPHSLSVCI